MSVAACTSNLRVEKNVTARWLLSNLIVCLQHHINYTSRVRKHGTLLYRRNGNLLTSISHLLYKSAHENCDNEVKACTGTWMCKTQSHEPSPLHTTLDDINSRLHQQVKRFLATDLNAPYPAEALDIKCLVSDIDPILWNFIRTITRSFSERSGRNVQTSQPDTLQHHVKQVHCLFCLCAIMFCIDNRCSIPFHTLITDTIESFGGSSQLIRVLNRIGVCSSADTLARFIQCKVKERERNGPEEECSHTFPTIITFDNIDF